MPPNDPWRWLAVLFLFLAALLWFSSLAPYGCITRDEGWLLASASRVARGDWPIRDFQTVYPPTQYFVIGAAFQRFGESVMNERLTWAFAHALVTALTWHVGTLLMPRTWALGPALVVSLVPGPWHKTALGLAFVLGFSAYAAITARPARGAYVLGGVAIGLTVWIRQDVGAAVLLGTLLAEAIAGNRRALPYLAGGAFVGVGGPAAIMLSQVPLAELARQLLFNAINAGLPQARSNAVSGEAERYGLLGPAVAVIAATGPALCLGTLWSARDGLDRSARARVLIVIAVAGLLVSNQLFRGNTLTRFFQFGVPWQLLFFAGAASARTRISAAIASVWPLLLVSLTLGLYALVSPEQAGGPSLWSRQAFLHAGNDTLRCDHEQNFELSQLGALLGEHLASGDPLLVLPGPSELGFLTGHPNPTRYARLDGSSIGAIQAVVTQIEDGTVPWVLADVTALKSPGRGLSEALAACCDVVAQKKSYTLWRARAPSP